MLDEFFRRASTITVSIFIVAGCGKPGERQTGEEPAKTSRSATREQTPPPDVTSPDKTASPATSSETPAVPPLAAKYDGKIVKQPDAGRGRDDGLWFVRDGKRRWIQAPEWLEANGYSEKDINYITTEEFYSIPVNPEPLPLPAAK